MPTPKKGPRLGGSASHQKAILSNLATSLFEHGTITTTEAKARLLRPYAERLVTKAKRGDLHNRRQVMSVIRDKSVVHVLFTEIGPRFADRPGGYTHITKIGPRKGDNAPMAVIELVEAEYTPKVRSTSSTTSPRPPAVPAEASVADTDEASAAPAEADSEPVVVQDEAEAEQVEAQEAVATQEPHGESVEAEPEVCGSSQADETSDTNEDR